MKKDFSSAFEKAANSKPHVVDLNHVLQESTFDYKEIKNNDKEELIRYENEIKLNGKTYVESYKNICVSLSKAQSILANYDKSEGKFAAWYELLGMKKNYVYRALDRYKQYMITKNDYLLSQDVSIRSIELISKIDDVDAKVELAKKLKNKEIASTKEVSRYIEENYHFPRVGNDNNIQKKISPEEFEELKKYFFEKMNDFKKENCNIAENNLEKANKIFRTIIRELVLLEKLS